MLEYLEKFEELSHSILLYNTASDDTYFVIRFMGGVKEESKVPIALHRPRNVLEASSLALLQEEALAAHQGKTVAKDSHKAIFKPALFLINSEWGDLRKWDLTSPK